METKGQSITTGVLKEGKALDLKVGQDLLILTDFAMEGDNTKITTSYKELDKTVDIGSTICVSLEQSTSDFARMEVVEVMEGNGVKVIVREGGRIGEKEIMKFPGANLYLDAFTDRDETDITEFGVKSGIDIISVSFTRKKDEIEQVRSLLDRTEHLTDKKSMQVFAKIENLEGLNNYEEILAEADGIIISRADLEQELPSDKMFLA